MPPVQTIEDPGEGTNVVFIVNDAYFVKLFTDLFNGDRQRGLERLALQILDGQRWTPKVLGSGELYPGESWPWEYVVTEKLEGEPLDKTWESLDNAARLKVATSAGEYLRMLHGITIPDELRALVAKLIGPENFASIWARQVESRAMKHGVPEHLARQAGDYVARWLPKTGEDCILHGDLSGDHLIGQLGHEGWEIEAVIDYGDLKLGNPVYDLIPLHLETFEGDKFLLGALLEGYGVMPEFSAEAAMSFTLVHEWDVLRRLLESRKELADSVSIEQLANEIWRI
ncbi:MAG: hygromycin-B 7-O-kinase [Fimbriimonadaceae bacterium]|nr:hygromycin-B 7-O-kinase [Fimbriimonadaceae bacterium]